LDGRGDHGRSVLKGKKEKRLINSKISKFQKYPLFG
jgi:hypothetical protein